MQRDRSTHIYGDDGRYIIRQLLGSKSNSVGQEDEQNTNIAQEGDSRAGKNWTTPEHRQIHTIRESPLIAEGGQTRKRKLSTSFDDLSPAYRPRSADLADIRCATSPLQQPHTVWSEYCSGYEVNFGGGFLHVASRRSSPDVLALIRREHLEDRKDRENRLAVLDKCHNEHVVRFIECFEAGNGQFLVFEAMHMSLLQVASAVRRPGADEIAAIARQMLHGLKALAQHKIVHGRLKMVNVLANLDGKVKIFLDESCHVGARDTSAQRRDIAAVGDIMLELAAVTTTEEVAEDPTVTVVDRPDTDCTRLREFQLATQSDEIDSLLQHPFLAKSSRTVNLRHLFYLVHMSSRFAVRRSECLEGSFGMN